MNARVIVTGASGAIGGAACVALRARGARVVGLDLRAGHDIIACDVRDQASVDAAVAEAIERLGGLDVLINNAGIGIPQSAGEAPGDAITVTTVYPGYNRTPIHDAAAEVGIGLDGVVPPEKLSDAAGTLVRAVEVRPIARMNIGIRSRRELGGTSGPGRSVFR
jgi:NAD(P)-dependent dehydrogenase (short-subunit alcohol dehydrogenase family)